MKVSLVAKVVKQCYKKRNYKESSLTEQQVIQTTEFPPSLRQKLNSYMETMTPINYIGSSLKIFAGTYCLIFLLNIIDIGLTVSIPFIDKAILKNIRQQSGNIDIGIISITGQIAGVQLLSVTILVIKQYFDGKLNMMLYSYLLSNISHCYRSSNQLTGNKVNFIDDDAQRATQIPYCLTHAIFLPFQTLILCYLLSQNLPGNMKYLLLFVLFFVFIFSIIALCSYRVSYSMMKKKDQRLQANLAGQNLGRLRDQEVSKVKLYFVVSIMVGVMSQISYFTLFIAIFWVGEKSMTKEQKYSALIILQILRGPMTRLAAVGSTSMQVYNSLKRISDGTNDLKKTLLSSQLTSDEVQESLQTLQNKEMITRKKSKKGFQKGNANLGRIYSLMRECLSIVPFLFVILALGSAIGMNLFGKFSSQSVVSDKFHPQAFIPLPFQILSTVFVYVSIVYISLKLSRHMTNKMVKATSYEVVNRYSGDLTAVDRKACTGLNDFMITTTTVISTLAFTMIALGQVWLQIGFFLFVSGLIFLSFKINRYYMWSRREVMRMRNLKKTELIECVSQPGSTPQKVINVVRKLYASRMLGVAIEIIILSSAMLTYVFISSASIILCLLLKLPEATTVVLLTTMMGFAVEIQNILNNGMNFELNLVEVQRCLNADLIAKKVQNRQSVNINDSFVQKQQPNQQ